MTENYKKKIGKNTAKHVTTNKNDQKGQCTM